MVLTRSCATDDVVNSGIVESTRAAEVSSEIVKQMNNFQEIIINMEKLLNKKIYIYTNNWRNIRPRYGFCGPEFCPLKRDQSFFTDHLIKLHQRKLDDQERNRGG